MSKNMHIGVIVASNRPVRNGGQVASWVQRTTDQDKEVTYTYMDLSTTQLPWLAESKPPMYADYELDSTRKWSEMIAQQDGFLFIVPEYNHGYPASLKNALDTLYAEWSKKPVAYVGYGVTGAMRCIEQLNNVLLYLEMYPLVQSATHISLFEHLDEKGQFIPSEQHQQALDNTIKNLKQWTEWLQTIRTAQ